MRVSLPLAWPRGVLWTRQGTSTDPAPRVPGGAACPVAKPRAVRGVPSWGFARLLAAGSAPGAVEEDVPCARAILAGC